MLGNLERITLHHYLAEGNLFVAALRTLNLASITFRRTPVSNYLYLSVVEFLHSAPKTLSE
jgi:hypothetical protein